MPRRNPYHERMFLMKKALIFGLLLVLAVAGCSCRSGAATTGSQSSAISELRQTLDEMDQVIGSLDEVGEADLVIPDE